jgi:hypothetical protein
MGARVGMGGRAGRAGAFEAGGAVAGFVACRQPAAPSAHPITSDATARVWALGFVTSSV